MQPCKICGRPVDGKSRQEPASPHAPSTCLEYVSEDLAEQRALSYAYLRLLGGFELLGHEVKAVSLTFKADGSIDVVELECYNCCGDPRKRLSVTAPFHNIRTWVARVDKTNQEDNDGQ